MTTVVTDHRTGGGRPGAGLQALTGVPGLVRLILRRDRVVLALWLIATVGVLAGAAASTMTT